MLKKYNIKFDKDILLTMALVFARIFFYGNSFYQVSKGIELKVSPKFLYDSINSLRTVGFLPLMVLTIIYFLIKKKYIHMVAFILIDFILMYILFSMVNNYMMS